MDANTVQSFHKAIQALDAARTALNSLQGAIEAEQGRVFDRTLTGEDLVCHLPNPEMLPDASPLRSLRSGLCRLLTEFTPTAHIVVIQAWKNEDDDHSVYTVTLTREFSPTFDMGAVNLTFHVESQNIVRCVASEGKMVVRTTRLTIDGPKCSDVYPYGDLTLIAFSTREKAIAWCETHCKSWEMCGDL